MQEIPLTGGRITPGVVRAGDTVRRPRRPNSAFVRALLTHLLVVGFESAPRALGDDELGREVFTFLEGEVPADLDASFSDETLAAAARLIRRFHDATAGSSLAGPEEVVCHGDLSPCNVVFRAGEPVGLIDFDAAIPGPRLDDLGYALFAWLNLGTDGPEAREQRRRLEVFCSAYGAEPDGRLVESITTAVMRTIERLRADGRHADLDWWQAQLGWLERSRAELLAPSEK
jgi:hypothetical protein